MGMSKYTIPVLFFVEDERPEEYTRESLHYDLQALHMLVGRPFVVGVGVLTGQESQIKFEDRDA
jgi:hypothetical protein